MATTLDLDQLAHRIARYGVDACEPRVMHLARRARTAGVADVAVGILADRSQPEVVRERAFARVVSALEQQRIRHLAAA